MKRLITIILILALLLPAAALADVDLSGMTYEELVILKDRINLAMWNSQEWQEVTVPAGVWEVGKDIPEGHWTISQAADNTLSNIVYTDCLDEFGKDVGEGWKGWYGAICNKKNKDGTLRMPEYPETADIDMKAGMFFITKTPVIFTPYTGKPGLGFK